MQSQTIGKLAEALSKAQSEYNKIIKDCTNPFFHSKYADLSACIESVREALANNGLAVVQATKVIGERNALETTIMHTSGEWITGEYLIVPMKDEPQAMGAAMTYARRYALCGILNVASEDDDGETAQGRKPEPQAKQSAKPSVKSLDVNAGGDLLISEEQALDIVFATGGKDMGNGWQNKMCDYFSKADKKEYKEMTEIPSRHIPEIMQTIKNKPMKAATGK
jgi:hypothetical protein